MILRETYQVDPREGHAIAAGPRIEPGRSCHEQLAHASPDLLRHQLATLIDALTGTQADAFRGADHGARSPERANVRNGYRHPDFAPRTRLSSSQVSRTAQDLDEQIATFRTGPLDAGPHMVAADAPKREGRRRARGAVDADHGQPASVTRDTTCRHGRHIPADGE